MTRTWRRLRVAIVWPLYAVGLVLAGGCGQLTVEPEQDAGEPVERVAIDELGDSFLISVDGEEMEYEISVGTEARLPESFPKDVPVYEGIEMSMAQSMGLTYSIMGTVPDSMDEVGTYYRDALDRAGWAENYSMDQPGDVPAKLMSYSKQGRSLSVTITSENGKTQLSIMAEAE